MPNIDLSNYEGREQAYVKHSLLDVYLPELAYRVGKTWDVIAYIDGFAGPWKTHDPKHADSSFGIAVKALRRSQTGLREKHGRELHIECVLVEQERIPFVELERFAVHETSSGFNVHAIQGEFIKQIPIINRIVKDSGDNPFKFILLDPTGWAQIPMEHLKSFLHERSSEVLVNLNTRDINRFLDQPNRSESYRKLFGRSEVLEILQAMPAEERPQQAVLEYSQSLKDLCGFKYVSSAVILEPNKEAIRYFLVFATNHPRGIEVFKGSEMKAARIQDDIRHQAYVEKTKQPALLFDTNPPKSRKASALQRRYVERARQKVIEVLTRGTSAVGLEYKDLFCEAMFFPLVTPSDLRGWLKALEPNIRLELNGAPTKRKPKPSGDFRVVVTDVKALK